MMVIMKVQEWKRNSGVTMIYMKWQMMKKVPNVTTEFDQKINQKQKRNKRQRHMRQKTSPMSHPRVMHQLPYCRGLRVESLLESGSPL